jgi:peptidyl-prolyl cis-trans isomerase D
MIEQMRRQLTASGWTGKRITAMVIFGIIILVFILFGFQGKHTAMGVGAAARVNNTLISVANFRNESDRVQRMYAQIMGGAMAGDAQRQFVAAQALENLIQIELISQAAQAQKIQATDAEIRDYILSEMPVFRNSGAFDREIYARVLENIHLTPAEFEERIRKERLTQRAREIFQVAVAPSILDLDHIQALKTTQVNYNFVKLDEKTMLSGLSDAEATKSLAGAEFSKRAEAEFQKTTSEYAQEEQISAQHILIKFKNSDEASQKVALEKIQALAERAKKEDFSQLAKEVSEDLGSQKKGGDLGTFGKGRMVPEFEKAAFAQEVGVVGAPVKTQYGYHLIKVLKHQMPTTPKFEDVKITVAKKLLVADKLAQIEAALKAGNSGSGLDDLLKILKLNWAETGWVDLSSDSIQALGSRIATQEAFNLSAAKPLSSRIIQDGSLRFILKWKAKNKVAEKLADVKMDKKSGAKGASKPEATSQEVAATVGRERGYDVFGKWVDEAKKGASIDRNPLLMHE